MRSTEKKKLESSFLAVCIAGGVGAVIYLALEKCGFSDLFKSKNELAKEILKKETLVNERLKKEILEREALHKQYLENEWLKKEVLESKSLRKQIISQELSKNIEMAEEASVKLTNTKNYIETLVIILEYLSKKTELEIQNLASIYKKDEQALTEHFSQYDSLNEQKRQYINKKTELEITISHLREYPAAININSYLNKRLKELAEYDKLIETNAAHLKEVELKSEAIYKSFEQNHDLAQVKNRNLAIYKERKAIGMAHLYKVNNELNYNIISLREMKGKKSEE